MAIAPKIENKTIRYEHIMILDGITKEVMNYFRGSYLQMAIWFTTPNEKLESRCPCDLMKKERSAKALYVWLLENKEIK